MSPPPRASTPAVPPAQPTPPLVALVAGLGDAEALRTLLDAVPPASALAFVLVDPAGAVRLEDLPVPAALRLAPWHDAHDAEAGTLSLAPGDPDKPLPAANLALRNLAAARRGRAAAVLMGRAACDLVEGLRWIRAHGGLVAAVPELPCAGEPWVDWLVPAAEVPPALLRFFDAPAPVQVEDASQPALGAVLALLHERTRCDFTAWRRDALLPCLTRRMRVNHLHTLAAYLEGLRTRAGECDALCDELLDTPVPFFGGPAAWRALSDHLPTLLRGSPPHGPLRAWVAGCGQGAEAYSVAMLLCEQARRLEPAPLVQVFATDASDAAVRFARDALYSPGIEADVPPAQLQRFFTREPRGWRVRRELRETVLFARHDALHDPPFSRLDLAVCHQLPARLDNEACACLLRTLHFALRPGGLALLGGLPAPDEAAPHFEAVDAANGLYRRRAGARASPLAPRWRRDDAVTDSDPGPGPALTPAAPADTSSHGWSGLHLRLIEQLAPPSLLVDGAHDVLHLSPGASRFLRPAGGAPRQQLLALVAPTLRIGLRSALLQAAQTLQPVEFKATVVDEAAQPTPLAVRVKPFLEGGHAFFLVLFQPLAAGATRPDQPPPDEPAAHTLGRELDRLQQQLREAVEHYEASNEELKASNEELLAMNEELQVAAQEVTCHREELSSANAELLAVNGELQDKLHALQQAHSGLDHLLEATGLPTVFLDRELRVMRYTPAATRIFRLIPGDVGRPLAELASAVPYPQLEADARQVLAQSAPLGREVRHEDGRVLVARVAPYRGAAGEVAGLVVCFGEPQSPSA